LTDTAKACEPKRAMTLHSSKVLAADWVPTRTRSQCTRGRPEAAH
jgi:hypothetical protein